jgi:hypothetical protein
MSDECDLPLTIGQLVSRIPGARGARRLSPSTVTRWILRGCPARDGHRVRLRATRAGSRWLVRQSDLDEFFKLLAADPGGHSPSSTAPAAASGPKVHRKRAGYAAQELERRGA